MPLPLGEEEGEDGDEGDGLSLGVLSVVVAESVCESVSASLVIP